MITIQNYFKQKQQIDWSKVSDTVKGSLEDIELLIQTVIDVPDSLEVAEIKTEIDIFLSEINKHTKKKTSQKTSTVASKKTPQNVSKPKTENKRKSTKAAPKTNVVKKMIDINTVDHFSTEYRLIRRFYNLIRSNKSTTFRKIQLLYLAFQKAALDRSVRKTSSAADLFTKINTKVVALFDTVNPTKSDANIEFADKGLFNKIETYVKGEKVNYAITLLKSYVSLQGLKPDSEKVQRLIKRIDNAIEKKKVTKENRLYEQLLKTKAELENYLAIPTAKIAPEQIGLSKPASNLCENRVKCTGLRKDGKLKKGYQFAKGGNVVRSKKKAV